MGSSKEVKSKTKIAGPSCAKLRSNGGRIRHQYGEAQAEAAKQGRHQAQACEGARRRKAAEMGELEGQGWQVELDEALSRQHRVQKSALDHRQGGDEA